VAIGLVYLIMVILFGSLWVPVVILFALLLAVIGAFVPLAMIGHATNIITGLAVSLHAVALPVAVIAAGIGITYSVGGGLFGVALAAAGMLSMVGIVVAVAILTPIGMPTVPTSPILMAILPMLPILCISTNSMDSFVNMPLCALPLAVTTMTATTGTIIPMRASHPTHLALAARHQHLPATLLAWPDGTTSEPQIAMGQPRRKLRVFAARRPLSRQRGLPRPCARRG
jgi:hypothetical protein